MNIADKLYTEWAWRTKSGIPDINSPEDKSILNDILSELNIPINEKVNIITEEDDLYDRKIAISLFGDQSQISSIPDVNNKITIKPGDFTVTNSDDLRIWKELYKVKPPKKDKDITSAGSAGVGNGEIALYWLLKWSGIANVNDGRGGGDPDIKIGSGKDYLGLEVKSYDTKAISLGRFGSDEKNRTVLSTILGIDILVSDLTGEKRKPSVDTFNKKELTRAFDTFSKFSANSNLRQEASKFPVLQSIYNAVDGVLKQLNLPPDLEPSQGAAAILRNLLLSKASTKPGFGGYMVNVSDVGKITFDQVTQEKINSVSDETILNSVYANGASLIINSNALFG
jgi:hypothetical protein